MILTFLVTPSTLLTKFLMLIIYIPRNKGLEITNILITPIPVKHFD